MRISSRRKKEIKEVVADALQEHYSPLPAYDHQERSLTIAGLAMADLISDELIDYLEGKIKPEPQFYGKE